MECTVYVRVSIPVGLAFNSPPTFEELKRAALEGVLFHPAVKDTALLAGYVTELEAEAV